MHFRFVLGLALSLWPVVMFALVPLAFAESNSFGGAQGGGLFGGEEAEDIVTVTAQFTTPGAGRPATLFVTATIKPGWHIYSLNQARPPIRTQIKIEPSKDYRVVGEYQPSQLPERKQEPAFDNLTVESHHGTVTWSAPLEFSPGVDPTRLQINGAVKVQPCDPNVCMPPRDIPFTAARGEGLAVAASSLPPVATGQQEREEPRPESVARPTEKPTLPIAETQSQRGEELPWRPFTMAAFKHAVGAEFDPASIKEHLKRQLDETSFWREMLLGFLGGLLLNLMPCVLPVIGLKILSFVEQSGHNRWQALMLNVWYAVGLLSVFLVLASLAVFLNLGWGHLFKYAGFNIAMAAVVFVMGLSFLGVWEIPLPGFVGRGKAAELTDKEGFAGAFAKGVITTILATPCTGPFMGSALAWAVNQPPANTYAVFAAVGLGMASPYLLIGAFPRLIRFLPRPGVWMVTFKQIMGFVLLATVVYIFTFLSWSYVVPTIGLLFALWGACWWIARVPLTASSAAQAGAWLAAVIFVGVMWVLMFPGIDDVVSGKFSFGGLHEVMASRFNSAVDRELAERLEAFRQRGYEFVATGRTDARADGPSGSQTVLVDFTADWCATCKTLEATRLNTAEVRALVEKNGVVPMKGDWTHEEPEVTAMLDLLGARQVPTLAIFPAENPSHPIIFRGWYSLEELLAALEKAGPSRPRVTVRAATGKQGAEKKSWSRLESTDAVAYK